MAKKQKIPAVIAETEIKAKAGQPYIVFARRFRPQKFSEVAGQAAVTSALRQALNSGRLAQAYLFCGPRGVGKTSLARILAKAINCLNGKGPGGVAEEPCNACEACEAIQNGHALDVIEMDAATNRGIEEVRTLRDNVGLAPAELRYKVYIIDEVHMLTREAWNAFLKTLEEPPPHVKFIFATTDPNNVPDTILSRCQRFDLRRIGPGDIVKRLKQICEQEKLEFDELALSRIASLVRGGLRDAEGLLDQAVNLSHGKVTDAVVRELSGAAPDELIFEVLCACLQGQAGEVLAKTHAAIEAGADPEDILHAFIERLRGALLHKVCGADSPLLEGQAHLKDAYAQLGTLASEDQIMLLIQLFTAARRQMRDAAQTRLPLEMALIRAAHARDLVDLGKLIGALEGGAQSRPPPRQEGSRPNSPGRWADNITSSPAANPLGAQAACLPSCGLEGAGSAAILAASGGGLEARAPRLRLAATARAQKGGAVLAGALSFAAVFTLDETAGSLTLGFAPDQLLYKDALEKPENQAALRSALAATFGHAFKIVIARAAANLTPNPFPEREGASSSPSLSGKGLGARLRAAASPESSDGSETEIEFDEADALPLRASAPPAKGDDAAPLDEAGGEDGEAGGPPQSMPLVPALNGAGLLPAARTALKPDEEVDLKELEKNPWLQMVLKESGGMIVHAARKAGARVKAE